MKKFILRCIINDDDGVPSSSLFRVFIIIIFMTVIISIFMIAGQEKEKQTECIQEIMEREPNWDIMKYALYCS